MAIARLTHLRLSIPLSGAPPGQVPASCFPDAVTPVTQPLPHRVSFAEEVITLNTEESPVLSPISPPLTQPVLEEMDEDTPTSEVDEFQITSPESGTPPPPGFPPFVFPEDDGGMDADEICARFGGSTTGTCQQMGPELPDIPEETKAPEVVVPRPPSIGSDTGGGLCLFAFTVGEQWCYARTGTDACPPSANGMGCRSRWCLGKEMK